MGIDHTSFKQAVEYVGATHPGVCCSHVLTFSDAHHYGRVVHIVRDNDDRRYFGASVVGGLWTIVSGG